MNNTVGQRLRKAREDAGLSVGQVAKLLDRNELTITNQEDGVFCVNDEELSVYAETYGESVEALRTGVVPITRSDLSAHLQKQFDKLSAHDQAEVLRFVAFVRDKPRGDADGSK